MGNVIQYYNMESKDAPVP